MVTTRRNVHASAPVHGGTIRTAANQTSTADTWTMTKEKLDSVA